MKNKLTHTPGLREWLERLDAEPGEAIGTKMAVALYRDLETERDTLREQLSIMNTRARYDAVAWERDEKERGRLKNVSADLVAALILTRDHINNPNDKNSYADMMNAINRAIAKAEAH